MNNHKGSKVFVSIFSILASLFLGAFSAYLSNFGYSWFIFFTIYFALETIVHLFAMNRKDTYKGMRSIGRFQVINSIVVLIYLLMMLFRFSGIQEEHELLIYISFGSAALVKLITMMVSWIAIHKDYSPQMHALRNSDLLTIIYLLLLVEVILIYKFFPDERPTYVLAIGIGSNALLTIVSAFIALSTIIRAKTRTELTAFKKIVHMKDWFVDNEISMWFGFIFIIYLSSLAIMNAVKSAFYIFLAVYYIGMALIRFINYLLHRGILSFSKNKIKENRWSSWILLFDSIAFTLFSDFICAGAIILALEKFKSDTNMYYFIFMILPFALIRFIMAIIGLRNHKKDKNTYKLGLAYISLLTALMSAMNVIAISSHQLPVVWKSIIIIGIVIILKIFVLALSIAFFVRWIKSLVDNRKSKEKEYLAQNN